MDGAAVASGFKHPDHRGPGDLEVIAAEGDVLLCSEKADQPHQLLRSRIMLYLVALAVSVNATIKRKTDHSLFVDFRANVSLPFH